MSIQEFTEVLKNLPKECEWVEFKKDNSNPQEVGEYLSELSNNGIDKILYYAEKAYLNALKILGNKVKTEK